MVLALVKAVVLYEDLGPHPRSSRVLTEFHFFVTIRLRCSVPEGHTLLGQFTLCAFFQASKEVCLL